MSLNWTYDIATTPIAGVDESGRGCLAGPVFAAAVILQEDYRNHLLNDSKLVQEQEREKLRREIEEHALAFRVAMAMPEEIDKINILRASVLAMHRALEGMTPGPKHILVDGNYFHSFQNIPFSTVIGGDGTYACIAAASILAKTYRDDYMRELHTRYPDYHWDRNKGYATEGHRKALQEYGPTPYHRKSFRLLPGQYELPFP